MGFDGLHRNAKAAADGGIGETSGHPRRHLQLPFGELLDQGWQVRVRRLSRTELTNLLGEIDAACGKGVD